VGDVRDRDRLVRALDGIDTVFHCAALKHVESGEYNPFEATQTNVVGTQNVIDACLATGVETMILTSSDKAANPTSVMGASKLLAEKLVSAATNYRGGRSIRFASVRFGNVLGSRGSALELFFRQIAAGGPVTVTDPSMTRFVMSTDRAVELAIRAAEIARGGEVFVFKMPAARLSELVEAAIDVVAPASGRDVLDSVTLPVICPVCAAAVPAVSSRDPTSNNARVHLILDSPGNERGEAPSPPTRSRLHTTRLPHRIVRSPNNSMR